MKNRHSCLQRVRVGKQKGFSLIELLVATAIGLVLLGGIYQVFVGSTTGYRYNEQLSRLQENGRFVLDLMTRDIRMAGYIGCAGQKYNSVINSSDFAYDFGQGIYGLDATGSNAWADNVGTVDPTLTSGTDLALTSPLGGSDIFVVRGVDQDLDIGVTGTMIATSADLKVTAGLSDVFATGGGDILLVSDCTEAIAFQSVSYTNANGNLVHNTGTSVTPGNSTNNFGHPFAPGAQVLFPRTTIYYIGLNGIEPALYRKIGLNATEELIEGVENIQVLYGEDTDADRNVDVYRAANAVADWDNIVAIRIGLLLRSPGEIGKKALDTATYVVNGTNVNPIGNGTATAPVDDRRMRQVFVTTVGIRNRLP